MHMNEQKHSIKNKSQYEALRREGASKEKAARIANTEDIDHDSRPYEERRRHELYRIARKLKIDGRSKMDKDQLIEEIRNHE